MDRLYGREPPRRGSGRVDPGKARVSVSFGSSFGPGGKGFIRVNVGAPRPVLQEGLERVAAAYPLQR